MPSYRKDRPDPERGPRPGPHHGPHQGPGPRPMPERPRRPFPPEEEGEPLTDEDFGYLRRERPSFTRGGGTPYTSRPIPPEERLELEDVLVPDAERIEPEVDYNMVFSMFPRWGQRRPAVGPGPSEMPGAGPQRGGRAPGGAPAVDPSMFFDLSRIWAAAGQLRQDQRFRSGSPVAVVRMMPQAEAHRVLRVRPEEVTPLLEEIAYAVNYVKPRELPGRFLFTTGKDGFIWLAYVE
jgi:hypothetical protein